MNKQRFTSLVIILALLVALIPASASAAGGPPGNWASGISCQNLSSTQSANVTLYFYQEDNSSPVLTYVDPNPVPASGFRGYYTPSSPPGVPDGFLGSVVVSSNTEMACNVNTETTAAGTKADPYRKGTSAGFNQSQTATKMYAPQVMRLFYGYGSYISVQNTSTTSSTTVTITYKDRAGVDVPGATESRTIPANTNHIFYQNDNTGLPLGSNGFVGAATISSSGGIPIAVTTEFYASGADFTTAQLHSYNGFSAGANKLLIPRFVRNYYGYNTGITIQNVGGGATTVQIKFNTVAGTSYTYNSGSIPVGAALALYLPDVDELDPMESLPLNQSYGNAIVQAAPGGSVVAIVNEDNRGGVSKGYVVPENRIGQGSTYNAFADGAQANTAFFPQVTDKAGGVFSGGFQFSNTTDVDGTCDIEWANTPSAFQNDLALVKNGTISIYAPNHPPVPDGFNASVKVTCTVPIIGIANMAADPQIATPRYGDSYSTSNGLSQ